MKYIILSLFILSCASLQTGQIREQLKSEKVEVKDDLDLEDCNDGIQIEVDLLCKRHLKDLINIKDSNKRCKGKYSSINYCVRKVIVNKRCHVHVLCGVKQ